MNRFQKVAAIAKSLRVLNPNKKEDLVEMLIKLQSKGMVAPGKIQKTIIESYEKEVKQKHSKNRTYIQTKIELEEDEPLNKLLKAIDMDIAILNEILINEFGD